jgi:solute:Na+ symporter, SSS family
MLRFDANGLDYAIMAIYFAVVLGIGVLARRSIKTGLDFFLSGRSLPAWVTGLAFVSANLGALEILGMAANGAQYGVATVHFYWIGAVPAMIFLGLVMMPFYYGSKVRSVPEYLRLRFNTPTHVFNAATFAIATVLIAGINLFALALVVEILLGWPLWLAIAVAASIVLTYITLGGLSSAIYNEVLQFFVILAGLIPMTFLGLKAVGGWSGLEAKVRASAVGGQGLHAWQGYGLNTHNSIGSSWFAIVFGLGFVLSFGYWCTDFLVIQRAMAAKDLSAAQRTPLIAAFPKMFMPFVVILPGVAAVALMNSTSGYVLPAKAGGGYDYDQVLTTLMAQFYPSGMLGIGLTALMASFMSGMAGNVTAFNTVFTYDLYQSHIKKNAPDEHYLWVGRITTVGGVILSVLTAYVATKFNNIMDFLQLVFGFVNAPLFATFLLGMFWKRTTGHAAFTGLLLGTGAAAVTHGLTVAEAKGGWIAPIHQFPSTMAQNFWIAIFAWTTCLIVTIVISLFTKPKTEQELHNLVYGITDVPAEQDIPWHHKPKVLALIVAAVLILLNVIFW